MLQRVLWVSLTQALRSVALVLLPCAFLSLLTWATAGSTEGNTFDPMRVAGWLFLAAHHIPFDLLLPPTGKVGVFSYLPLGALIFPFLAIRSGFIRARNQLEDDVRGARDLRLMRSLISIIYSGFAFLVAWVTTTSGVEPRLYTVPLATLPISWLAMSTVRNFSPWRSFFSIELALRFCAVVTGVASLALAFSLFVNQSTIRALTVVLEPGWLGGVLLFFIGLLYIPNAILASLSYLIGPGFTLGAGTSFSALTHDISQIPALPILGALPTGRHPIILLGALGICAGGIFVYRVAMRRSFKSFIVSLLIILAGMALLAFLSSGQLLTEALTPFGVSTWKFTLVFALEFLLGTFLAWLAPWLVSRLRGSSKVAS